MKPNHDVLLERLKTVSEYSFRPLYHLNQHLGISKLKSLRIKSTEAVLPKSQFSCTRISSLSLQGKKTCMSSKDVKKKKSHLFKKVSNELSDEVFLAEDFVKILKLTPCKQSFKKPADSFRCRLRKTKPEIRSSFTNTVHIQTQIFEEDLKN